ncbi:sporulation protein YjcZ [Halalkalibacter krulwichiae]|nr:sporulation protein YjcZ [Halalkalibacter krulwichiae]
MVVLVILLIILGASCYK